MYFGGRTWLEFVRGHNLKPGYFLVFSYRGDMIFHFRVYDLTICEIRSYFKSNIDAQGQEDNGTNVEAADKHVKFEGKMEGYDEISHMKKRKLSNPNSLMKKKTLKYSVKDVQKAGEYEVTICRANLVRSYMNIPWRFSDTYGLSELKEIALMDPKNRMWGVHLHHRRIRLGKARNASKMGTPWTEFARANDLKVGDACIFRMYTNKRTGEAKYMKVEIRRMNES